jgi:hypothetical protein
MLQLHTGQLVNVRMTAKTYQIATIVSINRTEQTAIVRFKYNGRTARVAIRNITSRTPPWKPARSVTRH